MKPLKPILVHRTDPRDLRLLLLLSVCIDHGGVPPFPAFMHYGGKILVWDENGLVRTMTAEEKAGVYSV